MEIGELGAVLLEDETWLRTIQSDNQYAFLFRRCETPKFDRSDYSTKEKSIQARLTRSRTEYIVSSMLDQDEYLYLTTIGRVTGQPREIEIWFVESEGKFYILAEHHRQAQWVKNILRNPRVHVSVGANTFVATARVLDETRDRDAYEIAQRLMREKYDWGNGLPVEIVSEL